MDKDSEERAPARKTFFEKLEGRLPLWVTTNLKSKRSWKTLARCWLAAWAVFILLLPNTSLRALGNAAFFGLITALIMPPSMPVQMFIFGIATMVVGMGLGWAVGAAAMKAALAARNQNVLRAALVRAQEGAAGAANPDAVFQLDLFQGVFLDWRSSLVYGVFLAVAAFVFGTIVTDIYCTFGPLFPIAQYTILSSLFISVGCYVAIAITCIILVFPETLNHSYLVSINALLDGLKSYAELQGEFLNHTPEEIADSGLQSRSAGARSAILAGLQALPPKSGLIEAEFSWGRWNGSDCKALEEPLKLLVARMSSFHSFPKLVADYVSPSSLSRTSTVSAPADSAALSSRQPSETPAGDTELIRQLLSHRRTQEAEHSVRLEDVLPPLRDSTAPLRAACIEGLGAARALIEDINERRWQRGAARLTEREAQLGAAIEGLNREVRAYRTDGRSAVEAPFLPLLRAADTRAHTVARAGPPIRALLIASVFAAQLVVTADSILELLELIRDTSHKRRRSRLWAPGGLRALGKWLVRRDKGDESERILGEDARPDADIAEKNEEKPYRRDPDSRPPANLFQKVMDVNHKLYVWSKTPEAIYIWKYVIITIALWLPSVFTTSAHFYYVEKGVWALIMAQTTLNIYVSDQLYNYAARLMGTFMGLVVGLLSWYIGNGRGNGSPYGSAASFGVFLVPALFVRIFAPPTVLIPFLMFGVTLALIMGYSWIDGHLITISNPGIGWTIAWKRWVLVVIGCVASFILMMIPPTSGRKAVRLRNAAIISELSSLYTLLMSAWIMEEEGNHNPAHAVSASASGSEDEKDKEKALQQTAKAKPKWVLEFRKRIIPLAQQIQSLRAQTATAKWEGGIRGAWPSEEYNKLVDVEGDMLAALAQLSGALAHLDPTWRMSLNRQTLILNPNFITDVTSTFALVSQALRTSEPLHQILPTSLLDRLLYHHSHKAPSKAGADDAAQKVNYASRVQHPEFMYFATGVAAVQQIISCLDELHLVTKSLCGEIPFRGFNEWRQEYERVYVYEPAS